VSIARWLLRGLALAGVGLAPSAGAEPCRCADTSFAWQGCDAGGCDPGGWTDCTPTADDHYTLASGCHVEVEPGDDVLLEHLGAQSLRVESGASLTLRGPVEWRVGPGGFQSEPGSRVELAGCFRRVAGAGDECTAALGADNLFAAGDVVPCLDGDCDGDGAWARIAYAPEMHATIAPLLARIDVARDVLCFWQAGEGGYVGADAGYCYKITSVGSAAESLHLDFDVRQVWRAQSDQAGYPLARREVQQGTLQGDHPAGSREIQLSETGVVAGRTDQMGRWVRCAGQQRAYLIASVRDEPGGDVLVLADDRGIVSSFPDGERCHVDWGWGTGDLAFVMAPVHVTSATNGVGQVFVRLEGALSLRGVVFDGLGGNPANAHGAVQIVGGPLERLEHVWIADPLVHNREALFLDELPCDSSAFHVTITGGPPDPAADKNYGVAWFGGATCGYTLTHFYPRFTGDDAFVLHSAGADPIAAIHLRYVHAGPTAFPGDSGQLLDLGAPNPTVLDASDMLCTACTTQDGYGALIGAAQGGGEVSRTLWVGAFNGGALSRSPTLNAVDPRFVAFGLVGSAVDVGNVRGAGPLVGLDTERFYVRDYSDTRPSVGSQLCVADSVRTERLRNGVFLRTTTSQLPCDLTANAELSDVYFIDVARSGTPGPVLRVEPAALDASLTRLTMAFTAPLSGITRGISVAGGARLLVDGPLLTGFHGPGVASAMNIVSPAEAAQLDWGAPTCFFDNVVDDAELTLAAYGTPPIRGVDPEFVNPSAGRFDLAASSPLRAAGCGAREAGIRETNWAHRKAKLRPVYMGPPPHACGLFGPEPLLLVVLFRLRRNR
jgi:hypothetical protein